MICVIMDSIIGKKRQVVIVSNVACHIVILVTLVLDRPKQSKGDWVIVESGTIYFSHYNSEQTLCL